MLYWTIFFGAAASLVSFLPALFADGSTDVALRFLERGKPYTAGQLSTWIAQNSQPAKTYAFPILLGFDLIFLVCLGVFLLLGSLQCGLAKEWPGAVLFALTLAPLAYMIADAIEDVTLARFLLKLAPIDEDAVGFAQRVTKVKIGACGAAMAQTALLAAYTALTV